MTSQNPTTSSSSPADIPVEECILHVPDDSGVVPGLRTGRGTKETQYWRVWTRRKGDSRYCWISTGPAQNPYAAIEFLEFIQMKEGIPFDGLALFNGEVQDNYGRYDGSLTAEKGDQTEIFSRAGRFNPMLRAGGIKDFPKSQIIAYGWHRKLDIQEARPELKLNEVSEFMCEIDRHLCVTEESLRKHMRGFHPDVANASNVGKEFNKALSTMGATQISGQQVLELMSENNKQMLEMIVMAMKGTPANELPTIVIEPEITTEEAISDDIIDFLDQRQDDVQ